MIIKIKAIMYVVFIAIIVHIVYYNTVIVRTPHPCSSSCIITILYCIVIQYYYIHYAFDLSHSLSRDIMSSFRTKLFCSIFQNLCVIIQKNYNVG